MAINKVVDKEGLALHNAYRRQRAINGVFGLCIVHQKSASRDQKRVESFTSDRLVVTHALSCLLIAMINTFRLQIICDRSLTVHTQLYREPYKSVVSTRR